MIVTDGDFYDAANGVIYRHMLLAHGAGKPLDPVLLVESLKREGSYEKIGGVAYLSRVINSVPHAAHAVYYAELVRDAATKRKLILAGSQILGAAYDDETTAQEAVARSEAAVFAVGESLSRLNVELDFRIYVETVMSALDDRLNGKTPRGIPTGYAALDGATGGMMAGEVTILAGRTSMGKTALALNIAATVAESRKEAVVFFSLEMNAMSLGERLLSMLARVDLYRMRNSRLDRQDRERIVRASCQIHNLNLRVDDSSCRSVSEMAAVCRRIQRRDGVALVVIDYLQLINPDNPRDARHEQVARISRQIKGLARELNVPLLCLAQLNRETTKVSGNRPRLSHLRESGAIEQDADVVLFTHRPDYYTQTKLPESGVGEQAEVIIAKQRQGPTGTVPLLWFGSYTSFENPASLSQQGSFEPKRVAEFDDYNESSGNDRGPKF